jgi:arginase family enzyme
VARPDDSTIRPTLSLTHLWRNSGGLTWQQLAELVVSALHSRGCAGWSLSIYNPDLDPDRSAARRIVEFVTQIAPCTGR